MLESEMEDLLWRHPEELLNEALKPFRRQPRSGVGRADLVFEDRWGRLLIVEIKRGTLPRGAIDQLHDYLGMLKTEYPDRPVEMMAVAQSIPPARRAALEQYNIEPREISETRFRYVASQVGYVIQSEQVQERTQHLHVGPLPDVSPLRAVADSPATEDKGPRPSKPPEEFPADFCTRRMIRKRPEHRFLFGSIRNQIWEYWDDGCEVGSFVTGARSLVRRLGKSPGSAGWGDVHLYIGQGLVTFEPPLSDAEVARVLASKSSKRS